MAVLCKKLFPLGLHDRSADFPQPHFCNIAGGNTQSIDDSRCVKFIDMGKFVQVEIFVRPQAQSCHQHVGYADFDCIPIEHFQIEVVQFLQQAVLPTLQQVLQVVREVVCHGIVAGRAHGVRKIFFFGQVSECILQSFDHCRFKGWLHGPNGQWARKAGGMGVRNIKIEFQTILTVISEHGDALGSSVHPESKLTVPTLHLKDRRGVRALGVNHHLLVEWVFIKAGGGGEKSRPLLPAAYKLGRYLFGHLPVKFSFGWHGFLSSLHVK